MKKLLFFLSFSIMCILAAGQNPEGFNYQAVARDGSGIPVANTNLQVKVSILSDTTGFFASGTGTYIWEEQQGVKTNLAGVVNMVIGSTDATKVQGSAASFTDIDWTESPLFIGLKIQYQSVWRNMGTSRLWSVPYSMVTKGIAEGARISIVGEDDLSADALFEVKRKDGQTVFAVYNDAVNVYVPDQETKKAKGGFSVGGFDATKGFSQHYMTVTPDSIRFYINDNPGKAAGSKSGFAVGGYDESKGLERRYLSLVGATTIDTITNATQILWYPRKEAFLAGNIDILHPDSVGRNSFSMGYKNRAIGDYSHALGYMSVARGNYSTAIGRGAVSGPNSFAMGNMSKALGNDSYALGSGSVASGPTSFALGVLSESKGLATVSLGFKSIAAEEYAVAVGYQSKALANYSTSLGYNSTASNTWSTAVGYYAMASGPDSYAIGSHAEATEAKAFAIGSYGLLSNGTVDVTRKAIASGYCSLAFGMGTQASKVGAMALGVNTTAAGDQSLAMGYEAEANGNRSISIGARYNVTFNRPVWVWNDVLSKWVITYEPITLDKSTIADGDYSVALGNGNHSNNGGMTLGTNNDATVYGSVAMGHSNQVLSEFSFAAGFSNYIDGLGSFALGNNLISTSANSFVIGAYNQVEGTVNEWLPRDPLFVIGNGKPSARSNAFTVLKDGNIVLSSQIDEGTGYALYMDPLSGMIKRETSSSRYKYNINSITSVEWLYQLNPVSFIYNNDSRGRIQYGLIAEETESVNMDLVLYFEGKPDGINYNGLIAPMIRALQEQKSMIEELNMQKNDLKDENRKLKDRLVRLENAVSALTEAGK